MRDIVGYVLLGIPLGGMAVMVLWLLVAIVGELTEDWRGERSDARRARERCVCCRGYPVCWVGARASTIAADGRPDEILCARHTLHWAHIRQLERELLDESR